MDSNKMTKEEREEAKFSLSGATLYGINAVIGSGIFLLPRAIYKGLGPASIAVMFGTAILTIMLAVCFAEVAGYFGKNGGAFQYSKRAFGDFIGFNVGFLGWAVTIFAWAAMAAGFSRMFIITFPAFEGWHIPLSVGLIILLSLMNIAGLKTSKIFTITATIAKLIPIVAFSACALFFIKNGLPNFTPFVQLEPGTNLLGAISNTAVYIFYGFIGFETLSIVAGEMRDPEKNVPRAILGSISVVSVLYMLIIGGTIAMLGSQIMMTNAPVQDAFVKMIGPAGAWMVSIGALISITGLNMGESIMVPRYGAAIADEGLLPAVIAKQNKNGAPLVAILISSAIAIVLLLTGSFEKLAELSVIFRFFQYIPTALAVIKMRKLEPNTQVAFRVPFGPLIPIIAVIISLLMIWGENPMYFVYGLIGVIIATTVYFIMKVLNKRFA
ncbi:APC family permease [Streptococcus pseudoporcinus]|uniref:Amino acid permease n=1 Tax=Streptococcus pseudoporcinus TaxID=361101 RepID=A0A4U9XJ93_9STRE|nr:APC family permease [Streptococcus pseudoporcinus]VTS13059.1 amino acid permease [Streptococcus pseudoporcinus]VUC66226.1 amino acid permease [Streptococcus pseudoporcinus]VUC97153.1 amino acid permease [Streptococcus pseudoporcinus]VUC97541.1 amino acid permease [Streptococcus pseudoporcinus]